MANKYMKKCSTSLAISQILTKMTYPYIPIGRAKIKISDIPNANEDVEKLDIS